MTMYELELQTLKELYNRGIFEPEFYSQRITDSSVFNDYASFQKIPFMYKRDIRNTPIEKRTTTKSKDVYGVFSSSGTTGEKTFYVYNKNDKKVHEEFVRSFYTELEVSENDIGGVMAPVDTGVMAHTMMWQFTTMGAGYVNCPIPSPENIIDTISISAKRPTHDASPTKVTKRVLSAVPTKILGS